MSVVGRPLSDFKAHLPGDRDQSKFWLEYMRRNETGGDGTNKLLAPEGEVATGSWMSFAERIRQLRASRILRRNPILLNTFLGNITVANLLLDHQVHPGDSSSEEEVDMEDADEEADEEEDSLLSWN